MILNYKTLSRNILSIHKINNQNLLSCNKIDFKNTKETFKTSSINRRRHIIFLYGFFISYINNHEASAAEEEAIVTYIDIKDDVSLKPSEKQVFLNNLKIQKQNRVPIGFPTFIREGFNIKIIGDDYKIDNNGLIYKVIDNKVNNEIYPKNNQEVTFNYTGYNENGARIDSSYLKGTPSKAQLGLGNLIPGFELALKSMSIGEKRRVIIPPDLGPPVGPSTFFSAKQCEVFDIELLDIEDCKFEKFLMFSRRVCM